MTSPCTEKETLQRLEMKIDQLLEIINGNGKVGFKTQLTLHKTYWKIVSYVGAPILIGLAIRAVWASLK